MTRQFQLLADQAFSRTAGAPLVGGNAVRLLKDGKRELPRLARRHPKRSTLDPFRNLHPSRRQDRQGLRRGAVRTRPGRREGAAARRLARQPDEIVAGILAQFAKAGVEARSFGYPTIDSPLGWVSRDHRKIARRRRPRRVRQRALRRRRVVRRSEDRPRRPARHRRDDRRPGGRRCRSGVRRGVGDDRRSHCPTTNCRRRDVDRSVRRCIAAGRARRCRRPRACSSSINSWRRWRARRLWITDAYFVGVVGVHPRADRGRARTASTSACSCPAPSMCSASAR